MTTRRKRRRLISAVCTFVVYILLTNSASAGLQSAMLDLFDGYDSLTRPREFVAPIAGNDVPGNSIGAISDPKIVPPGICAGPTLRYDPLSGDLSAILPAAVLNATTSDVPGATGLTAIDVSPPSSPPVWNDARFYQKFYSLAGLHIDPRLLSGVSAPPTSTTFSWLYGFGPLEEIATTIDMLASEGRITWRLAASDGVLPGVWPLGNRAIAAIVDLGPVLRRGLTLAELQQIVAMDPALNFVDYFNHRGIASLCVPLSLEMTPEPSTVFELLIAGLLMLSIATGRRVTQRPILTHPAIKI